MKTLSKKEIKKLKDKITSYPFHLEDYRGEKYAEIDIDSGDLCMRVYARIIQSLYDDTSDLRYFDGTGYSYDLVEYGYFEIYDVEIYHKDDLIYLDKSSMNTLLEKLNNIDGIQVDIPEDNGLLEDVFNNFKDIYGNGY